MSERISVEIVTKVARLARLDLTAEEIDRTTAQLAGMLEHFADIDALDLHEVEPRSYLTMLLTQASGERPELARRGTNEKVP